MRERDLLNHIYDRSGHLPDRFPAILVGPGDDCAVVVTPRGDALLLTVDHLVEGRHFTLHSDLAGVARACTHARGCADQDRAAAASAAIVEIAHKAIARSVSDVAAMGGAPAWALATGLLPPDLPHADALFDAMALAALAMNCPLVGGDIAMWSHAGRATERKGEDVRADPSAPQHSALSTQHSIVLTVTVGGMPHEARGPVLRSGARPGDLVYVTGALGGSLRSGRHLSFTPRVAEATWLCDLLGGHLHAMIDVSDGLGLDASRIGHASGTLLEIDAAALPLHADVPAWSNAAAEGEDYELLFTAAASATVPLRCPLTGTSMTPIGRVARPAPDQSCGCRIRTPEGPLVDGATLGWDHADPPGA